MARLATNEERPHHPIYPRITVQRQGRSAVAFHGDPPWRRFLLDRRSCQTNILAVLSESPRCLDLRAAWIAVRSKYREASSSDDAKLQKIAHSVGQQIAEAWGSGADVWKCGKRGELYENYLPYITDAGLTPLRRDLQLLRLPSTQYVLVWKLCGRGLQLI